MHCCGVRDVTINDGEADCIRTVEAHEIESMVRNLSARDAERANVLQALAEENARLRNGPRPERPKWNALPEFTNDQKTRVDTWLFLCQNFFDAAGVYDEQACIKAAATYFSKSVQSFGSSRFTDNSCG